MVADKPCHRRMGLKVMIVRNAADQPAWDYPTYAYERIVEAAASADWLVIACPLSDRTRRMVGAAVFGAMPDGAHLVNVGRGEIVVTADLIEALRTGKLAGAYLDVFEEEPLDSASPLWDMPNVMVSPHSAGHSAGNEGRVADIFLENLAAWVADRPLKNVS